MHECNARHDHPRIEACGLCVTLSNRHRQKDNDDRWINDNINNDRRRRLAVLESVTIVAIQRRCPASTLNRFGQTPNSRTSGLAMVSNSMSGRNRYRSELRYMY